MSASDVCIPSTVARGTFVLVHGACHASWCWEAAAPQLCEAGYEVTTVDLPGRGDASVDGDQDLHRHVETVLAAIDAASAPVTLVGHSLGAVAVSQAVERRHRAVARVVFVNGLLVEHGEAALPKFQTAWPQSRLADPEALLFSAGGRRVRVEPSLVIDAFYNRCTASDAVAAAARLCAEPVGPLVTPVELSAARFGSVPKTYIGSRFDHVLPWEFQVRVAAACDAEFVELEADHSPFLSARDVLAQRLVSVAEHEGVSSP